MSVVSLVKSQTDQLLYDQKHQHHSWAYEGEYGPDHWAELDPDYKSCNGEVQSPINITSGKCINSRLDIEFHYHPFFVDLVNNGHTLIEQIVEPKALVFNEEQFTLLQFHFHTPSEHHINDAEYPMEIHFVHRSGSGSYAVVAVFIKEGNESNPFLGHFMKSLPTHVGEEIRSFEKADPMETFPKKMQSFYHYTGSLTTPPCTEGINWILMAEPVVATRHQIEAIHSIIHDDNRPIQEINDRQVYFAEKVQY
jgi:carbonic anhydrase